MDDQYAVLTGNVIQSSRLDSKERERVISSLKSSFQDVELMLIDWVRGHFQVFRGDSFQGVLTPPEKGISGSILLHAAFRQRAAKDRLPRSTRLRIAVGVGPIDRLDKHRTTEGSGDAFRLSGETLDRMKRSQALAIRTAANALNEEFRVECRLLDSLLAEWSSEQAEAVSLMMKGLTQEVVGRRIGISQPGVRQRLRRAGWDGIRAFLDRGETLLTDQI